MSDLEKELRDKIKAAKDEMYQAEQPKEAEEIEEVEEVEAEQHAEDDKPEESEEPEDDLEEEEPKDKSGKAFARMRNELKKRDDDYNLLKQEMARLQGMQEAMLKPKEEVKSEKAEEVPDRDLEPEAWMEYQLKERDKKMEALESQLNNFNKQATVSQAERIYNDLESKYLENDPTYSDAKKYYKSERARALKAQYPNATDEQIKQEVKAEEYRIVSSLSQAGLSTDAIFNTIKGQAVAMGYKDLPSTKKDNTKLKQNMKKSASLNDAPSANGDLGYSQNQMARMGITDIAKIASDPKELKKAHQALAIARMKANS